MQIVTGIDIVAIEEFSRLLSEGGERFSRKIFHQQERVHAQVQRLAGIFAAKEAIIKSGTIHPGAWLGVRIAHSEEGKPVVSFPQKAKMQLRSFDLSISHDSNFAIAVFVGIY